MGEMTREEAISLLIQVNKILVNSNSWLENTHEPLNMAFRMAIKALKQEPKWIFVNEELPKEKDGSVLATMPDKKVVMARYSEFSGKWYIGDMMGVGGPEPIAWIPIPKPFEPQESEDKE